MRLLVLCAVISMNLFIVVSTFMKEVLNIPIDYLYYPAMVLIAFCTILYTLYRVLVTRKLPIGILIVLLIAIFYVTIYNMSPYKSDKLPENNIMFFAMWAIPAAISGVYVKYFAKAKVELFFKIVFFTFAITFLSVILIPKLTGSLPSYINFGLLNYQNASYLAAFTVGLGIYFIISKSLNHVWLYILVTLITIPSVFIPGGRGGAVLLILYFFITFIIITLKNEVPLALKGLMYIIAFTVSSLLIYLVFTKFSDSRTFSYLQGGSLNLEEGTSGRGEIYDKSIIYIKESPFFGYGPFNYYHLIDNIPHNIITEMLLSFGLIGVVGILILSVYFIGRFIKNFDSNSIDLLVIFIAIYPLTLLMFSSNYLVVSEFWFVLLYFITKGRRQYE